jgi:hypothetical protein
MRWAAVLLALAMLLPTLTLACGHPSPERGRGVGGEGGSPTPAAAAATVRVDVPGGTPLAGRLYGGTAMHGVVLVPPPGGDTGGLEAVARALAAAGTPALVITVPTGAPDALIGAVQAAVAFLEGRGAQRVALVGEGAGGTLALAAGARASAVVALSAPASYRFDGGELDGTMAVRHIDRPVLFMAALSDRDAAAAAQRLYDAARDPRSLALVPGAARGAALLTGPDAGQALTLLQDFLRRAFSPLSA